MNCFLTTTRYLFISNVVSIDLLSISLEVLLALAMSTDENTQEHAVEALDELITIPSIQVQLPDSLI